MTTRKDVSFEVRAEIGKMHKGEQTKVSGRVLMSLERRVAASEREMELKFLSWMHKSASRSL